MTPQTLPLPPRAKQIIRNDDQLAHLLKNISAAAKPVQICDVVDGFVPAKVARHKLLKAKYLGLVVRNARDRTWTIKSGWRNALRAYLDVIDNEQKSTGEA